MDQERSEKPIHEGLLEKSDNPNGEECTQVVVSDRTTKPSKEGEKKEGGHISDTIEGFRYLEEPVSLEQGKRMALLMLSLIPRGVWVGLTYLSNSILLVLGYVILNKRGETDTQAAFGIYLMLRAIGYSAFFYGISQKMAIAASQSFGQGTEMAVCRRYFTQTFFLYCTYLFCLYIPFVLFSRSILQAVNLTEDIASGYYAIAVKNLPSDVLYAAQTFLMEYCYAQKIEGIFLVMNWLSMAVSAALALVLSAYLDEGFDGWIIGRTLFYTLNTVTFLVVYFTKTHPQSRGFCTLREAMKGYRDFIKDALIFWIGNVFEWSGWEISGYFNALSHDNDQISAFSSVMNVVYIAIDIGLGFLVVGRTRVNLLLGAGLTTSAKKVGFMVLLAGLCTAFLMGLVIYLAKELIADMYASHNARERDFLLHLLLLYRFFITCDMSFVSIVTMMRSTNNTILCTATCISLCIVGNFTACWYMRTYLDTDCTHIFTSMYTAGLTAMTICGARLLFMDWSKVALIASKDSLLGPPPDTNDPEK